MPRKKTKLTKIKPGIYNAMVTKLVDNGNGTVTAHLSIEGKGFTMAERFTAIPRKEIETLNKKRTPSPSLPMEGHFKYFVKCERGGVYTSIGADNVHHASNKATKLFGPMWSQVTTEAELVRGYHFISHRDFSMLLAALPN